MGIGLISVFVKYVYDVYYHVNIVFQRQLQAKSCHILLLREYRCVGIGCLSVYSLCLMRRRCKPCHTQCTDWLPGSSNFTTKQLRPVRYNDAAVNKVWLTSVEKFT